MSALHGTRLKSFRSGRNRATSLRAFSAALTACFVLLSCGVPESQAPSPGGAPLAGARPNIVLILADDLSFRDLSAWGQTRFSTPNLDRLAAGGVRFTQAYAGAPECAPSRGTLLTGLHTGHAPIRQNSSARGQDHLSDGDVTIAEVLKSAGYRTAFTGKWGVGLPGTPGVPHKQGFDLAFGFYDQARAHTFYPRYLYENEKRIELPGNEGFDMERLYRYNGALEPAVEDVNRYDDNGDLVPHGVDDPAGAVNSQTLIEERALEFVRQPSDAPFFLYFATQLPHGPAIIDNLGEFHERDEFPSVKHQEWAAMVSRLDSFVGRLVETLEDLQVLENTILLFASDNGYSMCGYFGRGNQPTNWPDDPFFENKGPFRGGKFSALEGGTRVPLFVYWSGKIEPSVSSVPVWLVDFMPTFVELSGARHEGAVDGRSLLPLVEGREDEFPADRPLYWEKNREQAVRLGPWKAFRKTPDDAVELYLIEEDLGGERDLAAQYPEIVSRVERIMEEDRTDHDWYWNPHETREDFEAKRKRAADLGQLQVSRRANTPD